MSRIAYVNGAYRPLADAAIHIEDRGFQFADSVYEVVLVRGGKPVDMEPHINRLFHSLYELQIVPPMERAAMYVVFHEVMRRNRLKDALLYIQISRGTAKREHAFPAEAMPTFVVTCRRFDFNAVMARAQKGVTAISQPDIRWGRCDIKTTSLLPNVLAKQASKEAGGYEAILVDAEDLVTEGSSTNVWMVTKEGTLVTRSTVDNILSGITRQAIKTIAAHHQLRIEERAFSLAEAKGAAELFLTSATTGAMPIITLDGTAIGAGTPGPIASKLFEAYTAAMT